MPRVLVECVDPTSRSALAASSITLDSKVYDAAELERLRVAPGKYSIPRVSVAADQALLVCAIDGFDTIRTQIAVGPRDIDAGQ